MVGTWSGGKVGVGSRKVASPSHSGQVGVWVEILGRVGWGGRMLGIEGFYDAGRKRRGGEGRGSRREGEGAIGEGGRQGKAGAGARGGVANAPSSPSPTVSSHP